MSHESYKWVRVVALLGATVQFMMVTYVVVSRVNYRYDLEWMEGASLVQVDRVLAGQALYTQPSLAYIPMIYPPLYFYLSAGLSWVIGFSFLPLRLLSFASTLGCLAIICLAVKQKTQSALIGLTAAGLFAATFELGGFWFDVARVDMLFIFLCLAGIHLLGYQTTRNSIVAGILFSLAFLTKQTALPIFIVIAASTLLLFRRQVIPFVGSFSILTGLIYLTLNASSDDWYKYYILALPATHQIRWSFMLTAIQRGFGVLLITVIVSLLPIMLGLRKVLLDKLHLHYYFVALGMIGTSILGRINRGAFDNAFVPAYAGLAILAGIGIGWLATRLEKYGGLRNNIFQTIVWAAIIVQFVQLGYNPSQQIPTQADRQAGDALVAELRDTPGNVLIPYHNYLALLAGKNVYFHFVAFDEIRGRFSKRQPETKDIIQQFNSTPFDLIIMDLPDTMIQKSDCSYTRNIEYPSESTFYPVTGYQVRPSVLYLNCP